MRSIRQEILLCHSGASLVIPASEPESRFFGSRMSLRDDREGVQDDNRNWYAWLITKLKEIAVLTQKS
jgi:hypothetical protein